MVSPGIALRLLSAAALATALRDGRPNANMRPRPTLPMIPAPLNPPVVDRNGVGLPPTNTTYYFDQLVDHKNRSAGTFKQRYWTTWPYWQPGGCVIVFNVGEGNAQNYADGYLGNFTINGAIAQEHGCATVVIEHQFYGFSQPTGDLTVKSLRLLTLEQSVADLDYFARNVKLPFPSGDQAHPYEVPWILTGGSYGGGLVSWTMSQVDTFWAGWSSSGVVQAVEDYYTYYTPIMQQMPKNCSADVQAVNEYIDAVFTFGAPAQQQTLKEVFGMGAVKHLDDVAGALRNNVWDWQFIQPSIGAGMFGAFCDALEVKDGVSAPAAGWGLKHGLAAWGKFWTDTYLEYLCGDGDIDDCVTTHNGTQTQYTTTEINHSVRSWQWQLCTELGWFQDGPPLGQPTIATRLVTPSDDLRVCSFFFPELYAKTGLVLPAVAHTNSQFKGWNTRTPRIFFGNGLSDPWKEVTVASDFHRYPNTTAHPVGIAPNGFHTSDLIIEEGVSDAGVLAVQQLGFASMARWIAEFKPRQKPRRGA